VNENKQKKKEEILAAYQFRHACKEFDPQRRIPDEDFSFILETGRLSPSSFGLEPWEFVIVQNQELREKLRTVTWGGQRSLPTASHVVIILARTSEDMRHDADYIEYINREIKKLPSELIDRFKGVYKKFLEEDFRLLDHDRSLFDWACKQTYIALGNMMTAAAQIGIDSCPIEGFEKEQVEAILREHGVIEGNHFGIATMVAFGYRVREPRPKVRQPMENIVKWIR
jgi:nitroreductase